jgi:hypothetical protein
VRLRIPAWAEKVALAVNDQPVAAPDILRGYARLRRTWQPGDRVALDLPMPVRRIEAHPAVKDDAGRVDRREGRITIVNADTTVPELQNFSVSPPSFSPNQDGLEDRAGVTYSLSKNVENIAVYLIDPAEPRDKFPLEERERNLKAHEAGFHYYDYDGGVDRGAGGVMVAVSAAVFRDPDMHAVVKGHRAEELGNRVNLYGIRPFHGPALGLRRKGYSLTRPAF